jgi:hypothetical protein
LKVVINPTPVASSSQNNRSSSCAVVSRPPNWPPL